MKLRILTIFLLVAVIGLPSLTLTGCRSPRHKIERGIRKGANQGENFGRNVGRAAEDLHESHKAWWRRNTN